MIPTLPTGARLALLNWPGGQPSAADIADAVPARDDRPWRYGEVVQPLLVLGLLEELPGALLHPATGTRLLTTFRLTQAGRKAVDVIQSGVEP
jgi:hypothetical protein